MAITVEKAVTRSVAKSATVHPEDVASLIVKAVGAPEGTALVPVPVKDENGIPVRDGNGAELLSHYSLSWNETPKSRKRKAKGTEGEQAAQ